MKNIKNILNANEKDFKDILVGRSIVDTTDKTILLDNGLKLKVIDHESCCASFEGIVNLLDFSQNVITRVTRVDKKMTAKEKSAARKNGYSDEIGAAKWSVNIYSANKKIAKVNMHTKLGTGNYGTSINLEIVSD